MQIKINRNIKMNMSNKKSVLLPVVLVTLAVVSSVFIVYSLDDGSEKAPEPNPIGLSVNNAESTFN